jgi:uncharacterized protein YndB with AHSA1/START domain
MLVSRNIDIAATAERVWTLVTDPRRRASLNPAVKVIEVEIAGGGPLQRDSSTRYRLAIGGRIVEYRTRVLELVPGRRLVTRSDSAAPFETTLELTPLASGTRLSHSERLEPTTDMIQRAIDQLGGGQDLGWRERLTLWLDGDASERLRDRALQHLESSLGVTLDRWLAAIRDDLERAPPVDGRLPA